MLHHKLGRLRSTLQHVKFASARWKYSSSVSTVKPRPKAVLFDLGGVIVPSPFGSIMRSEKQANLPPGFLNEVFYRSAASPNGAFNKLETGRLVVDDFYVEFERECEAYLRERATAAGQTVSATQRLKLDRFLDYKSTAEFYEDVFNAIRSMREEGIKTALITNDWKVSEHETVLDKLAQSSGGRFDPTKLFDTVVESCRVGLRKPDASIFNYALDKLSVKPNEAVFVDDIGHNLKGAKSVGIHTLKAPGGNSVAQMSHTEVSERIAADLQKTLGMVGLYPYIAGTAQSPNRLKLDEQRLKAFLKEKVGSDCEPFYIKSFSHGQSNPTYYVQYGKHQLVLRKKPPGKVLDSAHQVDREYRVMNALRGRVPVPSLICYCDDAQIIGTPFYVTEYTQGRLFKAVHLPNIDAAERGAIYNSMNDVLAAIHLVDLNATGLSDYGKHGGYLKRNLDRWIKQFEASKVPDTDKQMPEMAKLIDWLKANLPATDRTTLVHGDFRLDNLIFDAKKPEVRAVLDWELSTLGDPLTDLATNSLVYYLPSSFKLLSGFADTNPPDGIPSLEKYIEAYLSKAKISGLTQAEWNFYVAFVGFRAAAILQGVYKRALQGQASQSDAHGAARLASGAAKLGWNVAQSKKKLSCFASQSTRGFHSSAASRSDHSKPTSPSKLLVASMFGLPVSDSFAALHRRVREFVREEVIPHERELTEHSMASRWPDANTVPPVIEKLKAVARAERLWNLFLTTHLDPKGEYSSHRLTTLEYAYLAEELGRCIYASETMNCSAPDTGNMEVLVLFGTKKQKAEWLEPLLKGEIRSCFAMTEPAVASSDATNISASIRKDASAGQYELNGHKWWISGAAHPKCRISVFLGRNQQNPNEAVPKHQQHSMVLVPMNTKGVKVLRPLSVFGYADLPFGHCEMVFENVRVPTENILLGEGRGFEIAQARLGPGRIHHTMRLIGHSERALELMIARAHDRVAFGKHISQYDTVRDAIATSRAEIDQARLLVLSTAHMIDKAGVKGAQKQIAMIKVVVPSMAQRVIDRAMQVFGGAGLNNDIPLPLLFTTARLLRIADGPDAVHQRTIAKFEIEEQKAKR